MLPALAPAPGRQVPTSRLLLAGPRHSRYRVERYAYTETAEEARRIAGDPLGLQVLGFPGDAVARPTG